MMGSTHKTIGVVTGIVLALCGIFHNETLWILMMFTAPFGAMLPDIDHNNSKLGRTRKKVMNTSKKAFFIATVLLVALFIAAEAKGANLNIALREIIFILLGVLGLWLVTCVPKVKTKFSFFTKHRGIMHTLVVPAFIILSCIYLVNQDVIKYPALGLAIGYLTHIVADCLTREGCPILWPLTDVNISFLKITTGTAAEKVVAFMLCVGIAVGCWVCSGYLLK